MTAQPSGVSLALEGVRLAYADRVILKSLDLQVPGGQIVALLGPSGCGKTSVLRLVAGLLRPSAGCIRLGQTVVATPERALPPEQRGLGMVFQDYALWPHLTVLGNVMFPLQMRRVSRREAEASALAALTRVGLEALARQRPSQLSGGQQQRVALARALVARPALLLFDEPLSNLDRDLRESLCAEMAQLLRETGATALYVTHDRDEARALADRVVTLRDGAVLEDQPVLRTVAAA